MPGPRSAPRRDRQRLVEEEPEAEELSPAEADRAPRSGQEEGIDLRPTASLLELAMAAESSCVRRPAATSPRPHRVLAEGAVDSCQPALFADSLLKPDPHVDPIEHIRHYVNRYLLFYERTTFYSQTRSRFS
jgi:hypothetical protein